jgi:hypothetical protein
MSPGLQPCRGGNLALDSTQHGRHAAHPQRSDGAGQTEQFRHVVRDGKDLLRGQPVKPLMEHSREAPRCGGFRRSLEEQPHAVSRPGVVLFHLDGQEQRRLAFHHLLQELGVVLQPVRQFRQLA